MPLEGLAMDSPFTRPERRSQAILEVTAERKQGLVSVASQDEDPEGRGLP